MAIGADDNSSALAFTGDLDDIYLYNRVLNKKQVDSLFNDGKNGEVLTIEETENKDNYIFIYPNPASDIITIIKEVTSFMIYDINGTLIENYQKSNSVHLNTLSVKHLNSGVYIIRLLSNKKWVSIKLIKIN